MIKLIRLGILCSLFLIFTVRGSNVEIWKVTNIKGQTQLLQQKKDVADGFDGQVIMLKFLEKSGTVSGTTSEIIKIDNNTLIGYGFDGKGGGTIVEVYQINRKRNKMQMTQSRINMGMLDKVSYFIGDAKLVAQY